MTSRTKARELALQMLFQWEQGKHSPAHVLATFLAPKRTDAGTEELAGRMFEGTVAEASDLDALLREQAANWKLERMAAVDRNILRLGLYELRHHPENPPAVVINEALELARRYSTNTSVEFINGVLDALWRKMAAPKQ